MIPAQLAESEQQRFDSYVDRTGECWLWVGDKNWAGYGRFYLRGKRYLAHRVSFRAAGNRLVDGLVLDHLCRVRNCVNPAHLEQVTYRENSVRGETGQATGRKNAALTHCKWGHPFSDENTYWAKGGRGCVTCRRSASREYQRRNRDDTPRLTCRNGHPRGDEQTYIDSKGSTRCRECVRERQRRYRKGVPASMRLTIRDIGENA